MEIETKNIKGFLDMNGDFFPIPKGATIEKLYLNGDLVETLWFRIIKEDGKIDRDMNSKYISEIIYY